MPNENPVGANQPLDQHPLPSVERYILGADQLLVPSILEGTDSAVITVPPTDVVREVGKITVTLASIADGGVDLTAVNLMYIDASGNEAILVTGGTLTAQATETISVDLFLSAPFFLTVDDAGGGLFVRITSAGTVVADTVAAIGEWSDVRGVERQVVDLTAASVGLLPTSIPEGQAIKVALGLSPSEGVPSVWLLNYDTVSHGDPANVITTVSDEAGVAVGLPTDGAVATLLGAPVFANSTVTGNHQTGGNLNMIDDVGVTTTTPVIMTAFTRTNLGPVKPEQGGAF